jgi:hypothetical protein
MARIARVSDWKGFLCAEAPAEDNRLLRRYEPSGRSPWTEQFMRNLKRGPRRTLRRGKPGPERSVNSQRSTVSAE